ncbi:mannose-6-phosphate isomerase, class I [Oceanobacillus iheyensis]|uniref:mannose-6-phosphate isomerase, class I n=1 Tax=Oceanobacillus iheyensis TaxID=182710 RepID=UPI003629771D
MYQEPIFLEPVMQERIWGGKKLNQLFGYKSSYEKTGEAWVISAHKNGPNKIINGPLQGSTLVDAWENHGELFNKQQDSNEAYPLLIKILDANDDLSVQVHPDDTYAREVENESYGKTECWYVLDAEPDAELILGHHAATKEELNQMIDQGEWDQLLKRVPVAKGDFVHVPSGTIHAIGKGIVILETQQSSDVTYRVYDYDRKDSEGNKRELHLQKAKEVTMVPHQDVQIKPIEEVQEDLSIRKLIEAEYFTVYHWEIQGNVTKILDKDFLQISVIEGTGTVKIGDKKFTIEKGSNFILPQGIKTYELEGNAECIVSHPS